MEITLLQMGFVPVVGIILTLIIFLQNKTLSKNIVWLYTIMMFIFAILVATDLTDFYLASFPTLNKFRYFTTIIGYSFRPLAPLLLFFTIIRYDSSKKSIKILLIPVVINMILCALTPLNYWVFRFTADNEFTRGPLGFSPFITSGIYLIVLCYYVVRKLKFIEKTEFILVYVMIAAIIVSVVLESLTTLRCLLNGVGVISAGCYFLYLDTQTYRRDELTSLLNRRSFYRDTENLSDNVYVTCIDMNNLKELNDSQGHAAGDEALKTIARVLKDNFGHHSKVYRVGGDEFVVISKITEEELLQRFEKINELIEKSNLSIAYGYEKFQAHNDFEKVYNMADEKMYKCKELMKKKIILN